MDLIDKFTVLNDEQKRIDISKVKLNRNDSLIYFNPKEHVIHNGKTMIPSINYRFSFSKVVYNKNITEAVIYLSYRVSHRFPSQVIYFFEKKENNWNIASVYDEFDFY